METDSASTFSQLTPRHAKFVMAYIKHGNGTRAAREAGYAPKSAKSRSWQLLNKDEQIKKAIAELQSGLQDVAIYNATMAMRELEDAMHFAKKTNNATALVKAVETRAGLAGLMSKEYKVTINRPSIKAALELAHGNLTPETRKVLESKGINLPGYTYDVTPEAAIAEDISEDIAEDMFIEEDEADDQELFT